MVIEIDGVKYQLVSEGWYMPKTHMVFQSPTRRFLDNPDDAFKQVFSLVPVDE